MTKIISFSINLFFNIVMGVAQWQCVCFAYRRLGARFPSPPLLALWWKLSKLNASSKFYWEDPVKVTVRNYISLFFVFHSCWATCIVFILYLVHGGWIILYILQESFLTKVSNIYHLIKPYKTILLRGAVLPMGVGVWALLAEHF